MSEERTREEIKSCIVEYLEKNKGEYIFPSSVADAIGITWKLGIELVKELIMEDALRIERVWSQKDNKYISASAFILGELEEKRNEKNKSRSIIISGVG